jgi:hypothetical protein
VAVESNVMNIHSGGSGLSGGGMRWVAWLCGALWMAMGSGVGYAQTPALQVVYDNTANATTRFFRFGREHGDEVQLAGTARRVTRFRFRYFGDIPAGFTNGTYRVRFYANDGSASLPTQRTGQEPRTILWDSGIQPLLRGAQTPVFVLPGVDVPDRFTWAVQFFGVTGAVGNSAGLIVADPPTIGRVLQGGRVGSYWDAWIRTTVASDAPWRLINFGFDEGSPKANFFARIEAQEVPLPDGLAVALAQLGFRLRWGAAEGAYYVIEEADSITGPWRFVTQVLGEEGLTFHTPAIPSGVGARFYRLSERVDPATSRATFFISQRRGNLQWVSVPRAEYTIETSDEIRNGVWRLFRRVVSPGGAGNLSFDLPTDSSQSFYRIWRSR